MQIRRNPPSYGGRSARSPKREPIENPTASIKAGQVKERSKTGNPRPPDRGGGQPRNQQASRVRRPAGIQGQLRSNRGRKHRGQLYGFDQHDGTQLQ
nr:MAG TPA: hypothetical protein [Caudoviricetes sp.]